MQSAIRALKRDLSDVVHHQQLRHDAGLRADADQLT